MAILSIKRTMESLSRIEDLQALAEVHLAAHRALLEALGAAAPQLAGMETPEFELALARLRDRLRIELPPHQVQDGARQVGRQLDDFARACEHERERKAYECKQIVQMVAEAATAMAQSGAAQNADLNRAAAGIDAVARLESLPAIRQKLTETVNEIKTLATRFESEGRSRANVLESRVRRAEERLAAAQKLAETDAVTGLGNRRMAEQAIAEANGGLSLIVCDLDGFKAINDTYGHNQGDRMLVAAARALGLAVRPGDLVCRWGGDEFVVVLREAPLAVAEGIAAELQSRPLARETLVRAGRAAVVTLAISAGAAALQPGESPFAFFARADQIMYDRKAARKADRAAGAPAPMPAAAPSARRPVASDGMGSFWVSNETGAPLTVEVGGRSYAVEPGSLELRLPPGNHSAIVNTRKRITSVALCVSPGSSYHGRYTC